jgi:3-dehydroquinate dehydratase-1
VAALARALCRFRASWRNITPASQLSKEMGGVMNAFANLLQEERPIVAVSFDDSFDEECLVRAQRAGVELAELRIDRFASVEPDHVLTVAERFAEVPRLITIRSEAEGGRWGGTDKQRLELYSALMGKADAVDVELGSITILDQVIAMAAKQGVLTVVSYHNFDETPADDFLQDIVRRAKDRGADLVKISVLSRTQADVRRLARFTVDHASAGLISIGMGPCGTLSRVLFPALGSRLTYADIGLGQGLGQLPFDILCDLLRQLYPRFSERKLGLEWLGDCL